MNILVIGLGSMGKRRLELIMKMYPEYKCFGVDNVKKRREETSNNFGIICEKSVRDALNKFKIDSAFVCTSPLTHNIIIRECLEHKINVFTELNLVDDGYETNIELAKKMK